MKVNNKLSDNLKLAFVQTFWAMVVHFSCAMVWSFLSGHIYATDQGFNGKLWVISVYVTSCLGIGLMVVNFFVFLMPKLKWMYVVLVFLVAWQLQAKSLLYALFLGAVCINLATIYIIEYRMKRRG